MALPAHTINGQQRKCGSLTDNTPAPTAIVGQAADENK